jgi:hypothetical protein
MYAALLTPPICNFNFSNEVAEPRTQYHLLTERHIQAMWLEQKYFRSLKTSEGEIISIISPGIWNSGPGPDFFKAHLKIGNTEMRGDIELHLSDDSWYQHKHHLDGNYNNVILHVSYWSPKHVRPLLTAEGLKIPQAYFEKSLTIPEARILNLIDLELYPYIHFSGSGTCANSLFHTLSEKNIRLFFRSAAEWRLGQKYHMLKARSDRFGKCGANGIAMVLGYKHNAEAFSLLFHQISSQKFDSEIQRFAFALGQCGFFENKYLIKWNVSPYYQELRTVYGSLNISGHHPRVTLKLNKIRPPSHPVRRLAALVKLASDTRFYSLDDRLLVLWSDSWQGLTNTTSLKLLREELNSLLPTYEDNYWQRHYAFEAKAQSKPIALIGDDLKQEMIVNILLPLLYGNIKENPPELEAFTRLYASFPSPKTHKTKYLTHRFFGHALSGEVLKKNEMQQGAYQLHRDFCIHFEASCQGCPFITRYKNVFVSDACC